MHWICDHKHLDFLDFLDFLDLYINFPIVLVTSVMIKCRGIGYHGLLVCSDHQDDHHGDLDDHHADPPGDLDDDDQVHWPCEASVLHLHSTSFNNVCIPSIIINSDHLDHIDDDYLH